MVGKDSDLISVRFLLTARCKRLPPRPTNGFVVAPKTDHGQRALFICHDGYEIQGPNITFCHFGIWNISSPICHPS